MKKRIVTTIVNISKVVGALAVLSGTVYAVQKTVLISDLTKVFLTQSEGRELDSKIDGVKEDMRAAVQETNDSLREIRQYIYEINNPKVAKTR